MKTRLTVLSVALSCGLLPLSAAANDSDKIAALEQRIARLEAALHAMQRGRQRFAVVLGQGRREAGVITLNDILGSMFGEVRV